MKSLDSETTGVDLRHGAKSFLVTFCDEEGENKYWEADVDPTTREPQWLGDDLTEIENEVANNDEELILQNPRFDVGAFETLDLFCGASHGVSGVTWPWERTFCSLMAGHLLCSNQPHDLTTMTLVYLGLNIQPYEDAVKLATTQARSIVQRKSNQQFFKDWRIAKKGLPEMPSAKGESKERKGKGVEGTSPWKFDMWLPRTICRLAPQLLPTTDNWKQGDDPFTHPWATVTALYANVDSSVTLPLFVHQRKLLQERDLWEIYLERMKLLPVIYKMEHHGVSLNKKRMEELKIEYREEANRAGNICISIAKTLGVELSLPKASINNSLKSFLLDTLKLPVLETTKSGGPCLDKDVMEIYTKTLPPYSKSLMFVNSLMNKRKHTTSLQYMEGYERFWLQVKGDWYILYPSLNPTGTCTLRYSSSNPNFQNVSKQDMDEDEEDTEGNTLRHLFGPLPGREWWSLDYENIELRIPAYYSNERKMIEILEKPNDPPFFGSYHLLNASLLYPEYFWPVAEIKGEFKRKYKATWYQWDKNFGFAYSYGGGEKACDAAAHKVGAYRLVKEGLKEHSKLNQRMIDHANEHGYVETLPDKSIGAKRGYPIEVSKSRWGRVLPTQPLNYFVQSTAMYCTSKAMIRCQSYLDTLRDHHMIGQVHDEIIFDFPVGGKKNLLVVKNLQRLMEKSGDDIDIPLRVSISYHPDNWGEETEL